MMSRMITDFRAGILMHVVIRTGER
jgi:hypothetical protein